MSKTLNVTGVIDGIKKALEAVQSIAPVAAKFGVVANVATIAISAAEIGRNLLNRVEQGKEVLASRDETIIREMLEELQRANDELAKQVDAS